MKKITSDRILDELPLMEGIERMKDHHRISVFYNNGVRCVMCGNEGKRFILHDINHWDVFDADLKLMVTSKKDGLPYCETCLCTNDSKHKYDYDAIFEVYRKQYKPNFDKDLNVGDFVTKKAIANLIFFNKKIKTISKFNSGLLIDTVQKIVENPHTGKMSAILSNSVKEDSMLDIKGLVALEII